MPAKYGTTRDDHERTKTMRPGINLVQVVASACLAIALLALCAVATWSAFETSKAASTATQAGRLSDAYYAARFAIDTEESLALKYRLEPSAAIRQDHLVAKTN